MKKMFAVFKREYLQAVRKKMFIIMTFLMPVLMIALFVLPSLIAARGLGTKHVVVLDGTGQLKDAFAGPEKKDAPDTSLGKRGDLPQQMQTDYVDAGGKNVEQAAKPYLDQLGEKNGYDGVFVVPADALTSESAKLKYYSRSATDFMTRERLSSRTNRAVQQHRFAARGINAADVQKLMKDLDVDAVQLSKGGEQKKAGMANFLVGFIFIALLFIPSFIYGLEIMRGIIQEKTDRVVEVLVSSMSAKQLLVGKILGVAAVGLTQIGVWLTMIGLIATAGLSAFALAGENVLQILRPSVFIYFVIFFILGYLTYVCVYAIGGAVCNSEKEAQQLIMPITMTMMVPWFLMFPIITNPDSSLAVGFSLAPVYGPLTMFARTLVAEPPLWHIAVSILVSIGTVFAFFWVTAKIFRVGILSYGKRPTLPELWRWLKVA